MADIAQIFNLFQDYLNNEQDIREEIRIVVRKIEKCSREISITLQNIHSKDAVEENIIVSQYCAKAREYFEDVRRYYGELANIVPKDQYYRFHDQWRFVTQRLCFFASLIIYLEVKILVTKETVAELLGLKSSRDEGFHLDIEEFLMGLLELSSELTRFAVNSVTSGNYNRPLEIARFINELNAGFRLLNLKNDGLRKRYDGLKYEVKKIEEIVYDLRIRGLKSEEEGSVDEHAKQPEQAKELAQEKMKEIVYDLSIRGLKSEEKGNVDEPAKQPEQTEELAQELNKTLSTS